MENYVSQQLSTLCAALLLGMLGAWLYDLLRALRLRHPRQRLVTHLSDGLYILLWLLIFLGFALHRGGGELRLYVLIAAALGCIGYFSLFSRPLRILWDFWAETCEVYGGMLLYPLRFLAAQVKKFAFFLKKYFQFMQKYATMKQYRWKFTRIRYHGVRQGGYCSGKQKKNRKRRQKKG